MQGWKKTTPERGQPPPGPFGPIDTATPIPHTQANPHYVRTVCVGPQSCAYTIDTEAGPSELTCRRRPRARRAKAASCLSRRRSTHEDGSGRVGAPDRSIGGRHSVEGNRFGNRRCPKGGRPRSRTHTKDQPAGRSLEAGRGWPRWVVSTQKSGEGSPTVYESTSRRKDPVRICLGRPGAIWGVDLWR